MHEHKDLEAIKKLDVLVKEALWAAQLDEEQPKGECTSEEARDNYVNFCLRRLHKGVCELLDKKTDWDTDPDIAIKEVNDWVAKGMNKNASEKKKSGED
jgi:hypothetical protein